MRIWVVVEHLPHTPKEGFEEAACALFLSKETAEEVANAYNKLYAPNVFTAEPAEVY